MTEEEPSTSGDQCEETDETENHNGDRQVATDLIHFYECTTCGNVVAALNAGDCLTCHGTKMQPADTPDLELSETDPSSVFQYAFDVPEISVDICRQVVADGPVSTNELASSLDLDRRTVTFYLNRLVEVGFLSRARLNREGGGFVNVYYLPDPETLHRQLVTALFVWLGESLDGFQLCDGTNAVETDSESSPSGVYWETGSKITNRNQ